MESQRVGHNWVTKTHTHTHKYSHGDESETRVGMREQEMRTWQQTLSRRQTLKAEPRKSGWTWRESRVKGILSSPIFLIHDILLYIKFSLIQQRGKSFTVQGREGTTAGVMCWVGESIQYRRAGLRASVYGSTMQQEMENAEIRGSGLVESKQDLWNFYFLSEIWRCIRKSLINQLIICFNHYM